MVVILQKCVVSFITVLYNLCKTYLGNNPYKIEPALRQAQGPDYR